MLGPTGIGDGGASPGKGLNGLRAPVFCPMRGCGAGEDDGAGAEEAKGEDWGGAKGEEGC